MLDLHVEGVAVTGHIKGDIDAFRAGDARVDLVLEPILRNFTLNHLDVPAVASAEVAATTGDAEAALGAAGSEGAIGSADGATFAEGRLVSFFGWRLSLGFG